MEIAFGIGARRMCPDNCAWQGSIVAYHATCANTPAVGLLHSPSTASTPSTIASKHMPASDVPQIPPTGSSVPSTRILLCCPQTLLLLHQILLLFLVQGHVYNMGFVNPGSSPMASFGMVFYLHPVNPNLQDALLDKNRKKCNKCWIFCSHQE
jgi:hypothetical protein